MMIQGMLSRGLGGRRLPAKAQPRCWVPEGFHWDWREAQFQLKQISCSDTDELPAPAMRHCLSSVPDAEWEPGQSGSGPHKVTGKSRARTTFSCVLRLVKAVTRWGCGREGLWSDLCPMAREPAWWSQDFS